MKKTVLMGLFILLGIVDFIVLGVIIVPSFWIGVSDTTYRESLVGC